MDGKARSAGTSRYSVPNLERALAMMEFLANHSECCSITTLAQTLGFPKNSVFRILKTLQALGYVAESDRIYRLTTKLLSLGYAALGEVNLVENSIDVMRDLRDEAEETALIGAIIGTEGVVLEQVMGSHEIKFAIDVGHRFYLHTAAPGKAMLAFLPEPERDHLLETIEYRQFNRRTIANAHALARMLEKVRERGYAVDVAERIEGLHGVASPILNYLNYPVAAIWVTGPSYRMPHKELDRLGGIVRRHALRISRRLGHEPARGDGAAATSGIHGNDVAGKIPRKRRTRDEQEASGAPDRASGGRVGAPAVRGRRRGGQAG